MLELKDLTYSAASKSDILKDINLVFREGRITVITGPNGGGKTTLAKLIAGIEKPTRGQILLDGKELSQVSVTDRAQMGIAYAFQQPVRFKGITVRDLIETAGGKKMKENELCDILARVGLCARDYADRGVDAALSGGELKRIELATVLARDAKLLIFDEPEAGIDLWSFEHLVGVLKELGKESGKLVILISHKESILDIADDIVLLSGGECKAFGERKEIVPILMKNRLSCYCGRRSEV